jgi:hypothetical protein
LSFLINKKTISDKKEKEEETMVSRSNYGGES